jgi:hypothetical protein
MTRLALPETLLAYRDPATRSALDWVANQTKPPAGLTLGEVRDFYALRLASDKLRLDTWAWLETLWQQTWGTVLTDLEPLTNAADGSLPDEWALDAIDPADAVDDMVWLYNAHRLKSGRILWTGVFGRAVPGGEIGLAFSLWDGATPAPLEEIRALAEQLGEGWELIAEDKPWDREICTRERRYVPEGECVADLLRGRSEWAVSRIATQATCQ